jgi:NAD(P) transhydrogenase subunit alpha
MPIHASQLLSRNMFNLISHITEDVSEDKEEKDVRLNLDFEDEIISGTCIVHGGEIRHEQTRNALEEYRKENSRSQESSESEAG